MNLRKLLVVFFLLVSPALSETYRISDRNLDQVREIFSALKDGDEVVFERGHYEFEGGLTVEGVNRVTIRGEGKVEIVVRDLDADVINAVNCRDLTIRGLRARHFRPAKEYQCEGVVLKVRDCERVYITENTLNGCGAAGVYAYTSKDVVVHKNDIFNNSYAAIWVTDAQIIVSKNHIHDNAATLNTYGQCDITFFDNKIEDNRGNYPFTTEFYSKVTGVRR